MVAAIFLCEGATSPQSSSQALGASASAHSVQTPASARAHDAAVTGQTGHLNQPGQGRGLVTATVAVELAGAGWLRPVEQTDVAAAGTADAAICERAPPSV
jgi:hypothetical protein